MIESQMDEIEILEEEEPFNQILYYIYTGEINPNFYEFTLSGKLNHLSIKSSKK